MNWGLGYAADTKRGSALGPGTISAIIGTIGQIPQLQATGLSHLEILALLVPGIAEDRISDLTASVIKGWLAQFTERRCDDHGIPTRKYRLTSWDADRLDWRPIDVRLPFSPTDDSPVLLVPLNLLRHLPWINYADYYRTTYGPLVLLPGRTGSAIAKAEVLAFNRAHYGIVKDYVGKREDNAENCRPDPLFPLLGSAL